MQGSFADLQSILWPCGRFKQLWVDELTYLRFNTNSPLKIIFSWFSFRIVCKLKPKALLSAGGVPVDRRHRRQIEICAFRQLGNRCWVGGVSRSKMSNPNLNLHPQRRTHSQPPEEHIPKNQPSNFFKRCLEVLNCFESANRLDPCLC